MIIKVRSTLTLRGRRWYVRGQDSENNRKLFHSETYHNHADALSLANMIRTEGGRSTIDDSEWIARRRR